MAIVPSFSVSQSAATPADVTFTDASTGSDASVASRRIYVTDRSGNPVVPEGVATDYIEWALATNPKTVSDLLSQDLAVNITVQWLDAVGTVLYSDADPYCLRQFNIQFFIYLIQQLAQNPKNVNNQSFWNNVNEYWANISGADTMVTNAADVAASQNCLDRATNMMTNQASYFT